MAQSKGAQLDETRTERARDDVLFLVAFDFSPSGMLMVDREGAITLVNREIERIFGYTRDELLGQSIDLLVPRAARAAHSEMRATFRERPAHRAGSGRDLVGRRKDGSQVSVEIGLNPIETDEGMCVLCSVVDVSARKRVEAALAASETRYRMLSETSFDGIAVSEGGVMLEANTGFATMFGFSVEEVVGMPVLDFVAEESLGEMRRRVEANEGGKYEFTAKRRDGRKIQLEAIANVYLAGTQVRRVTALRDVTQAKSLERQFRQAQKMEAVGRLAGGVAHDFNNLLTVISSYTSLLLTETGLADPMRDDLQEISKAADSAATLTRQLLAFSRQQVLEPKSLDVNGVVSNAEKMLRRVIGEDVRLQTALDPALGCVRADAGQLEQVVMNMAVNARDAMPDGGSLVLSTANVDITAAFPGELFAVKTGSYVLLSIADSGMGMDEETRSRIFEPFFTTKETGRGTGLGLSMVYGIVKQSNGYILVDSEAGRGTTFRIYLPRIDAADEQPSGPTPAVRAGGGTETVLLVEDVAALREIERRVLEGEGYTVLDASDAQSAILIAAAHPGPIHLLLTDVVLPGIGGRELSEELQLVRPGLRVLFTSGYTDDAVVRRGIFERGVAFMQKPFTAETLAQRVREVLA